MAGLHHQRCSNHPGREAIARCPECRRFYCQECVVEHEDRLLCAACLARVTRAAGPKRSSWAMVAHGLLGLAGFFVAWMFFYGIGQGLLRLPDPFHEGTVWRANAPVEE